MRNDLTNRAVLIAAILASSMGFIDSTAVNVALPSIQSDLSASGAQLLWVVNAYLLMLASLILVGGSLGDQLGRKKILMIGIDIFITGSLASGLAPTIEFLIGARILQGIGGALMIPGSLSIITAYYDEEHRGRAIGTWSAVTTIVVVIGPVLGGVFSDLGLWRFVFLINLPLGIASLIILFLWVPESRDESLTGRIDFVGAILATAGLAGLTYGLISLPELGITNPQVIAAMLIGLFALCGFVYEESRHPQPLMPLHLFRSRTFSGANLLTLFLYGGLSIMTFFLSLNLIQIQGYSKTGAGMATLPFAILLATLSRWAGNLSSRRGPELLLTLGPAVTGIGFLALSFSGLTSGPTDYWTSFFPGMVAVGIGMGLTVAPLTNTVMGSAASHYSGTASGINNAISRTAGLLSIAVAGTIALIFFANQLMQHVEALGLPPKASQAVVAQASNLGNAKVPSQVPPAEVQPVRKAIDQSFVDTFRITMYICSGLAWMSALMAALLIRGGSIRPHVSESD